MAESTVDVLILGAGPAGLALAMACAEQGLHVRCVAPDLDAPWPNNYGVWVDEVTALPMGPGAPLTVPLLHTWHTTRIHANAQQAHTLARAYGQIDKPALQHLLLTRFQAAGGSATSDRVVAISPQAGFSTVTLQGGHTLRSRVVVDATGHQSPFLRRQRGGSDAMQVAYGCQFDVRGSPFDPHTMVLMDWRWEAFRGALQTDKAPSFLYVMPQGERKVFLQETSLLSSPPMAMELLRERLMRRMAELGIEVEHVGPVERCFIPMNPSLPVMPQATLGFGAAAGMVHPATGYLVAESLRLAPEVAQTLARGLASGGAGAEQAVIDAWKVIWPAPRLRTRALYRLGADILMTLETPQLATFFHCFFLIPPQQWQAYLRWDTSPLSVLRAMASVFVKLPWSMRGHLLRHTLKSVLSGESLPPALEKELEHESRP